MVLQSPQGMNVLWGSVKSGFSFQHCLTPLEVRVSCSREIKCLCWDCLQGKPWVLEHFVLHNKSFTYLCTHLFTHSCISERALLFCIYCEIPWLTFHFHEGLLGEISMTANTTNCSWCCLTCSTFGQLRTEAAEVLFTMDKTLKKCFTHPQQMKCVVFYMSFCVLIKERRVFLVLSVSAPHLPFFFFSILS